MKKVPRFKSVFLLACWKPKIFNYGWVMVQYYIHTTDPPRICSAFLILTLSFVGVFYSKTTITTEEES